MEVVVADLENILRYEMEKSFKSIEEDMDKREKEKKNEEKKERIEKQANPNSPLARLGRVMEMKADLLKQIEQKKAVLHGKDSTSGRKS